MFTPRLVRPEKGNPYYNRPPAGYNPCIIGNYPKSGTRTGYPGMNVLPNCVGYATGRFNEIIGEPSCKYLGNTNAGLMIGLAKSQGLEVTQEPTLGGAMVWMKSGGAGHIAIVEQVNEARTTVRTSESEWNGMVFRVYTRLKGDGNWRDGCYWMGKSYFYLGCIRNPNVEDIMTVDELIEKMTPEQAYRLTEKSRTYSKTLPCSSFAEAACRDAVATGISADGDGDGKADAPKSPLLRQEFFVILKRMGMLK